MTAKPAVIYITGEFESCYHVARDYPRRLWLQKPLLRPGKDDWAMWQFNQFAKLPGTLGQVDLDLMRWP